MTSYPESKNYLDFSWSGDVTEMDWQIFIYIYKLECVECHMLQYYLLKTPLGYQLQKEEDVWGLQDVAAGVDPPEAGHLIDS